MNDPILDQKNKRELWLSERGLDENDVMERYNGTEFVITETDEDNMKSEEMDLPEELQSETKNF